MSYDISGYGNMICDRVRTDAYARALRTAIGPQSVVADIGTGSGFFALLACAAGARHVYAIEPDPVILLAKSLARENGFDDRITFIQDESTSVQLPGRVDVIVSDLHGLLPYHERHIPAIIDARNRFLKPDGALIPRRDQIWATIVEAPNLYSDLAEPWRTGGYGLRLDAGLAHALNVCTGVRFRNETPLSEAGLIATLDFAEIDSPNLEACHSFTCTQDGIVHGLALWFDAELADGITFSNDPWSQHLVYGAAYLPVLEPGRVRAGDHIALRLRADLYGSAYVWSWTLLKEPDGRLHASGYAQSTLLQTVPNVSSLLGDHR